MPLKTEASNPWQLNNESERFYKPHFNIHSRSMMKNVFTDFPTTTFNYITLLQG